jgi:magnesium-transporting ATPase (P-type)
MPGGSRRSTVLRVKRPEPCEEAFDSDVRMMATFHRDEDRFKVAVKDAPEVVLEFFSQISGRSRVRGLWASQIVSGG